MALKLKGSTSGFVALDSPSVAGNNTLTLPENNGSAQQLLGNDITAGVVTFTSVTVNRNGDLTVPGTISIGGTLTYEDVTSVDSVGIVTARSGVRINGGGLTIIGDTTGLKTSGISTLGGDVSITGVTTISYTGTSQYGLDVYNPTSGASGARVRAGDNDGQYALLVENGAGTNLFEVLAGGGGARLRSGDLTILDKIGHYGDANTFIRFPANDTISLETAGSERLRVNSSGVVCVGTDTPNGSASTAQIEHSGENNVYIVGNTSTSGARIILQNKNTTANSFTGVLGADGGGQTTADIKFYSADNDTNEGYLTLETRPASGNPTEALRIDSSQRVLMGTTTEGYASADDLTIATGGNTGITIRSGTGNLGTIAFSDATSGTGEYQGYIQYAQDQNYMDFSVDAGTKIALKINAESNVTAVGVVTATQFAATTISNTRKNLIINGAMQFNERGNTPGLSYYNPVTASIYTLDRWRITNGNSFDTDSAHIYQSDTAPTQHGFGKSWYIDIGNTETPSSTQFSNVGTRIEGQDLQHLCYGTSSAKSMTLSFWVRSNKTGTYSVQLIQDSTSSSKYVLYEYTISSSNTWEKKTINIVGNTADVIPNDNTVGLYVAWFLTAGSGKVTSPVSSWTSGGSYLAATNQVNLWDNGSNKWYLTGCQLELGDVATAYDHRPTGEELSLCQRYFYQATKIGSTSEVTNRPICLGTMYSSSDLRGVIDFPVEMRAQPTLTSNDNSNSYYFQRDSNADFFNSIDGFYLTKKRATIRQTSNISGTGGQAGLISQETGDSRLSFEAEL